MSRVSFVVTVYNKAQFLPYVTAGLAAQGGDFDREFIFVDDGSTDGSADIVRRLTAGWANVVIVEQENRGPGAAAITGVGLAGGDLIKPVGGDDIIAPGATQALLEAMRATGCGVAFGNEGRYRIDPGVSPADYVSGLGGGSGRVERIDNTFHRSLRTSQCELTAALVRTDLVHAAGGLNARLVLPDYAIELAIARRTAFARVDRLVFLQPAEAPHRFSENKAQEMHDTNLALAIMLEENPDISPAHRRLALRRATSRAWIWARRRHGTTVFSPEFLRYLGAKLGLMRTDSAAAHTTCAAFRRDGSVRVIDDLISDRD